MSFLDFGVLQAIQRHGASTSLFSGLQIICFVCGKQSAGTKIQDRAAEMEEQVSGVRLKLAIPCAELKKSLSLQKSGDGIKQYHKQ